VWCVYVCVFVYLSVCVCLSHWFQIYSGRENKL